MVASHITNQFFHRKKILSSNIPLIIYASECSVVKSALKTNQYKKQTTYINRNISCKGQSKTVTYFWYHWSSITASASVAGQWEDLSKLTWTLSAFCGYSIDSICSLKGVGVRCRKRMIETHNLGTWGWHQLIICILCRNRWLSRQNGVGKVWSSGVWIGLLPSYIIVI